MYSGVKDLPQLVQKKEKIHIQIEIDYPRFEPADILRCIVGMFKSNKEVFINDYERMVITKEEIKPNSFLVKVGENK